MPAIYTHKRFGELVFRQLPEYCRKTINCNTELYVIGNHGPDILFYHKALRGSNISRLGYNLHGRRGRDVLSGFKYTILRSIDRRSMMSYAMGFVCHYVLDKELHPYVKKLEEVTGYSHSTIETELDRYMLERDGVWNPVKEKLTGHLKERSLDDDLMIARYYDGVEEKDIRRTIKSMIRYNNLLRCPNPIKRGIVYGVLKLIGQYKSKGGLVMRYKPIEELQPDIEAMAKILDEAVAKAVECVESFYAFTYEQTELSREFYENFEGSFEKMKAIEVLCAKK